MSASRCSVAHKYFRSSLRILFTAFLETNTQLWKLIWAISGCCIGSSGSPLHPSLVALTKDRWSCIYFTWFSRKIILIKVFWTFTIKTFMTTWRNALWKSIIYIGNSYYSSCKHSLTQLFWETCSLFCKSFYKLGYHAQRAQQKRVGSSRYIVVSKVAWSRLCFFYIEI